MTGHPGGEAHTRRMLALAPLPAGARILDLGAGDGTAVRLLRGLGYSADGLDLAPRSELVRRGNFLRTGLPGESFDGILSQCAFYQSGDVPGALRESARLLKPGGLLLLSDVFFAAPEPLLTEAGFQLLHREDMSAAWKDYFIDAIWRGEFDRCPLPRGRGKVRYWLLIARKR